MFLRKGKVRVDMESIEFELDDFKDRKFWDKIFKDLHTSLPSNFESSFESFDIDSNALELYKTRLLDEGYAQAPKLPWEDWFLNIREAIELLERLNIPLPFIFVCCEPWWLLAKLHKILEKLFEGEYYLLPDFWVWHVDPNKKDAGWGVHRDRGPASLFQNGKPKSLTVWIPLTDATTENGCMYVLPANHDTNYLDGAINKENIDLQDIVALPAGAGSPIIWNQAIMHWGARSLPRGKAPRISVAFEVQLAKVDPFNQPLIPPLSIPDFETRLKLVCKQILQYKHMYPLTANVQSFAEEILL